MKRKLHPNRRHGKRHTSAADRYEMRCSQYWGPFRRTPRPPCPFVRARKTNLSGLVEAGYPFASLSNPSDWTEVHAWLKAHCVSVIGKEYTWFGGTFVFARKADHAAFIERFACAEGYKPMFAFEVNKAA